MPKTRTIFPSAESQPPQSPHPYSLPPKPRTILGALLILKPDLQIGLLISPRSFVTLIIKKGWGEGKMSQASMIRLLWHQP